jgi:hypothetical protein
MVSSFLEDEGLSIGRSETCLEVWKKALVQNLGQVLKVYRKRLSGTEGALDGVDAKLRLAVRMLLARFSPRTSGKQHQQERYMAPAAVTPDLEKASGLGHNNPPSVVPGRLGRATNRDATAAVSETSIGQLSPPPHLDVAAAEVLPNNADGPAKDPFADLPAQQFFADRLRSLERISCEPHACAEPDAELHGSGHSDRSRPDVGNWQGSLVGRCFGASGSYMHAFTGPQVWLSPDKGVIFIST